MKSILNDIYDGLTDLCYMCAKAAKGASENEKVLINEVWDLLIKAQDLIEE